MEERRWWFWSWPLQKMGPAGGGGSSLPTNRRATGPAPGFVPVKRGVGEVEQKGGALQDWHMRRQGPGWDCGDGQSSWRHLQLEIKKPARPSSGGTRSPSIKHKLDGSDDLWRVCRWGVSFGAAGCLWWAMGNMNRAAHQRLARYSFSVSAWTAREVTVHAQYLQKRVRVR